jgi:sensor domain CHASE-containing protein
MSRTFVRITLPMSLFVLLVFAVIVVNQSVHVIQQLQQVVGQDCIEQLAGPARDSSSHCQRSLDENLAYDRGQIHAAGQST